VPGLLSSSRRLAQTIEEVTKGRIKIEVFPANTFVRALETFDAVMVQFLGLRGST
jgi:TRAP-type mannitol/chloroaromatic compound transport system substrate-binding protein